MNLFQLVSLDIAKRVLGEGKVDRSNIMQLIHYLHDMQESFEHNKLKKVW